MFLILQFRACNMEIHEMGLCTVCFIRVHYVTAIINFAKSANNYGSYGATAHDASSSVVPRLKV